MKSQNGIYGSIHGDPTEFFAATAFGGTTQTTTIGAIDYTYYSNTPICFTGSTAEPFLDGCEGAAYFDGGRRGWSRSRHADGGTS